MGPLADPHGKAATIVNDNNRITYYTVFSQFRFQPWVISISSLYSKELKEEYRHQLQSIEPCDIS